MAAGTLVDSNVLLDIFTEDATWLEWSSGELAAAAESGPLFINPIVYAEVSVRFSRIEDLDDALGPEYFRRAPLPWTAAFTRDPARYRTYFPNVRLRSPDTSLPAGDDRGSPG